MSAFWAGQAAVVQSLDALAAVLLAAAAAWRARSYGAHFTGAAVLGTLCGLVAGLVREAALHGAAGAAIVLTALPGPALTGALGGALAAAAAAALAHKRQAAAPGAGNSAPSGQGRAVLLRHWFAGRGLFFWLDSLSLGLAACLGTFCALRELGATGALVLGLLSGLAPGLVRDVALGDTALVVEQSWYATAAALGCVATVLLMILPATAGSAWPLPPDWPCWGWCCVAGGALLMLALRLWRGGRGSA